MDQQPRLVLDWGRNVLNDADLGLTMRCFAALLGPPDPARLIPYDRSVEGLDFWALNDEHWRCEIDWDRHRPFEEVMAEILDRLASNLTEEYRWRYLGLARAFERHQPEEQNITLTDAASIKLFCDRYFLEVLMPLELEERLRSRASG